jgi:hypothetical protein
MTRMTRAEIFNNGPDYAMGMLTLRVVNDANGKEVRMQLPESLMHTGLVDGYIRQFERQVED